VISAVMPTRNGEATIGRAIRSVLDQTHRDFELLVVDNGSSDGTCAIVERFAQDDPRVRLLHETRAGAPHARNLGLAQARFPWIAVHDDDDVSHPERFSALLAHVARDPRIVLAGSWALCFDDDAGMRPPFHHATRDALIRIQLRHGPCPFVASSVIYRREAALGAGGYRSEFAHCDDYCLWARLAPLGRMANVPRHLVLYRHQDPSRRPEYARAQAEAAAALKARYFRPISRLEDWRLRFFHRGARRRAEERIALDWPPDLLARHGLRELLARRAP
jgi:glycosyltransferase involved in cell wall biosynthesis